ncbi:four and a half LIM domains protein 3-like [Convolutriloba macropyga]|uniref:four and a half LIM domains protein 3-like n=1 Tax=Convolutriloba macropyga TaxID=536237 RepID=UPI003F51EB91
MSADGAESANRLKPLKGHVDRVERPEDMFLIEKDTSAEQRYALMKKSGDYMNIFICFKCRDSLFGKRFVKIERKPWCVTCYNENFATVCTRCDTTINVDNEDIVYGNAHWHLNCFRCSQCDATLFQQTFGSVENELYCSDCFFRCHRKWCVACNKPFKGGHLLVTWKEEMYHKECFTCSNCDTVLDADKFRVHGDDRYCFPCYTALFAPHCTICGDVIADSSLGMRHDGLNYHRACLKCHECETEVCDTRYFEFQGKLHCSECFEDPRVFGKSCVRCEERITDTTVNNNFYSVDHDSFWHQKCFTCTRCLENLDPEKSFICPPRDDGTETVQAYCEPCGLETLGDVQALIVGKFKIRGIEVQK